jgi:hypothetical protein
MKIMREYRQSIIQNRLSINPEVNNPKHKSESITFRLDSIILNKLRHEAQQKEVSVNTLVSQIIKQHADWHSNAAKAGFIPERKVFLMKLLDRLPEQDITSLAEYVAKSSNKDLVLLLKSKYNIESALEFIESWIRISAYTYRHEVNGTIHLYIIQHDMGRKWSIYLAELYRHLFEELETKKVDFDITDNTLSFVVDAQRRASESDDITA